jgi:pimeloyl-ACP methyl ester carboxylesterase
MRAERTRKDNTRKYGKPPYRVVVIHGGPGAAGEMAPVARELAHDMGVLEPLQTAMTLQGQVDELKLQLEKNAKLPAVLVGFSWGAWLAFILAADHPRLVSKLILVGSGGFHEKYGSWTNAARMNRMTAAERAEVESLQARTTDGDSTEAAGAFARFGEIYERVDAFQALPWEEDEIQFRPDIFTAVWGDAEKLRRSGALLKAGSRIRCPVTAIHGDYDPHPAEGVSAPLSAVLDDFKFILLQKCGHRPWVETHAKNAFYKALRKEIAEVKTE